MDDLKMAGNAWVEFSIGNESYDWQSLDYAPTAQDIEKVVTAKTTDIVGIDYDIVKALKKSEDIPFSALNMLRNVFLQRVAAFRNTPEGIFNSARALAVRQNVLISRNDEAALYRRIAELRAGENVSAAADSIASILTESALMSDLAQQLKNADEERAALIIKNIEGYAQGSLENTEITNYEKQSGKKINYVLKTNRDTLGQMLVEAKLMLSARGIDAAMNIKNASSDVPYGRELNVRSDEESLRILENENNEQLQKVLNLLNSLDTVPAAEAFAIIQEAINILNSLIESEALSENAKPIALSELLALLALKADFMPGNIVDTTSEGMKNIAANTRAVLAAA
jgi:ribosomal protein L7/L12